MCPCHHSDTLRRLFDILANSNLHLFAAEGCINVKIGKPLLLCESSNNMLSLVDKSVSAKGPFSGCSGASDSFLQAMEISQNCRCLQHFCGALVGHNFTESSLLTWKTIANQTEQSFLSFLKKIKLQFKSPKFPRNTKYVRVSLGEM